MAEANQPNSLGAEEPNRVWADGSAALPSGEGLSPLFLVLGGRRWRDALHRADERVFSGERGAGGALRAGAVPWYCGCTHSHARSRAVAAPQAQSPTLDLICARLCRSPTALQAASLRNPSQPCNHHPAGKPLSRCIRRRLENTSMPPPLSWSDWRSWLGASRCLTIRPRKSRSSPSW